MIVKEQAPYGRREKPETEFRPTIGPPDGHSVPMANYQGETYYGLPNIKASYYGWPIVIYFFIGGVASAAQFIATVIDLVGHPQDRGVVRTGRHLAFLGSLASPLLLIGDLHTPELWYNMLRIFRRTSPMSIGVWALTLFGTLSGFTAAAQVLEDLGGRVLGRSLARLFEFPAAVMGGIVSLYTGTLLAATSIPLWAGTFPFLSSLFAASAASTATASMTLVAEAADAAPDTRRRLGLFAFVAGAIEFLFALLIERRWRQQNLEAPIQQQPISFAYRFGALGLGIIGPLIVHALGLLRGRESRKASVWAAIATLIGGFILRTVLVFAGNESARRPEDYFRFTQPVAQPTLGNEASGPDGRS